MRRQFEPVMPGMLTRRNTPDHGLGGVRLMVRVDGLDVLRRVVPAKSV